MKKRNKYFEKEKAVQEVKNLIEENWQNQRNQCWIELDKPIPHGYNGEWVLRDDIARSPEAEVLQHIIDKYGKVVWSRNKDFKTRSSRKGKNKWTDLRPGFKSIREDEYEELPRKVKEYFVEDTNYKSIWVKWYKPYIDPYKLVMKKSRSYITHYREHDEVLYQEMAELYARLDNLTDYHPYSGYCIPKWYRKSERRKAKTKHRAENREIINTYNNGELEDGYYSTYKTKGMYWWW